MKYKFVIAFMFGFLLAPMALAQSKVEITATDLGKGVFMLRGSGGNMGLSTGKDGAFLVDDQFAPLSPAIKAEISKHSITPVRFLLNTHWHGDHTGGNQNFSNDGAIIIAHDNVRKRLSTDQFMKMFDRKIAASAPSAWPIITFYKEMAFYQNDQTIRVLHVQNAHTDGDAFVYFDGADVMHMGDVFFNGMYPFIDLSSGGSIDGVIAAQELALVWMSPRTKIIPGHGPLANRADLEETLVMLKTLRTTIADLIAKGLTADQAVATDPLSALNQKWGKGFMKPEATVRMVYADLSRKQSKP